MSSQCYSFPTLLLLHSNSVNISDQFTLILPEASSLPSIDRLICILPLNDYIQPCLNKNFKICIAQIVALMPLVNLVFTLAFFLFSLTYVTSNLLLAICYQQSTFMCLHAIYIHIIFYSTCYRTYISCMCKTTTCRTQKYHKVFSKGSLKSSTFQVAGTVSASGSVYLSDQQRYI